jgi:N-acetyl sugar amidotransferase
MTKTYQICTRCVMDTTDPMIVFDQEGVCNHCHTNKEEIRKKVVSGLEGEKKLEEIVKKIKLENKNKQYDCIIGVSGGVDSTYVAYKVKQLGLRPLAVHLDNGWDSELAIKNVENICRKLEIDLHTIVLDWNEFRDLQLSFLKASTPDSEIPSDHAIVVSMLETAKMIKINHIITGYNVRTETHLPSEWSQGHFDWGYIKNIQKKFGTVKLKTFPHLSFLDFVFPPYNKKFINILNYIDFSKKDAMPILESEIGWKYYGGKHYESIYTRWFQGYWLPTKFGYDKRRSHLSSLICAGEITKEEALEELKKPTYPIELQNEDTAYVLKKFDLTKEQLDEILNAPKKTYWDYKPYGNIYKSLWYLFLRKIYRLIKK